MRTESFWQLKWEPSCWWPRLLWWNQSVKDLQTDDSRPAAWSPRLQAASFGGSSALLSEISWGPMLLCSRLMVSNVSATVATARLQRGRSWSPQGVPVPLRRRCCCFRSSDAGHLLLPWRFSGPSSLACRWCCCPSTSAGWSSAGRVERLLLEPQQQLEPALSSGTANRFKRSSSEMVWGVARQPYCMHR